MLDNVAFTKTAKKKTFFFFNKNSLQNKIQSEPNGPHKDFQNWKIEGLKSIAMRNSLEIKIKYLTLPLFQVWLTFAFKHIKWNVFNYKIRYKKQKPFVGT